MTVMTQLAAKVLLLPIWMIAFGILVKGYFAAGDGFSAGVVAALGVLTQYVALGTAAAERLWAVRYARQLSAAGLILALIVVFGPVLWGNPIMTHAPVAGHSVIQLGTLELITAFVFDIGVFLLVVGFCIGVIDLIAHSTFRRSR